MKRASDGCSGATVAKRARGSGSHVSGTQVSALHRDPDDPDLAAAASAIINFQQQHKFRLPDDGVVWVDRGSGVEALHVEPDGPGSPRPVSRTVTRCSGSMAPSSIRPSMFPRSGDGGSLEQGRLHHPAGNGVEFKAPVTSAKCRSIPPSPTSTGGRRLPAHRAVRLLPPRQRA